MSLFENFPYTNFHELNLDWILQKIKELNDKFDDAISAKIKFADPLQWEINTAYEALTIVVNDDKAYLSMQPVPPGKLLTNNDYWQQIFNMSELYDMIDDLREDLSGEIDDLEDELSDDIGDLNTAITQLDANTVKTDNNKHILFLSDSYATWNSGALYTAFVNNCGVPADHCHNLAVSGSSFQDASNSFKAQLESYTGDKTKITDIVIAGGINDAIAAYNVEGYPDTSALTTAMNTFMTYANNNYPNAKCHLAYIGGCMTSSSYYSTYHPAKSQEYALFVYMMNGASAGFNYLPTHNIIHLVPLYYGSDGLHPNQDGAVAIGNGIAQAFKKQYVTAIRPFAQTYININQNPAREGQFAYQVSIIDDMVNVTIPSFFFYCNSGAGIGNTFAKIADLNTSIIRLKKPVEIPITALVTGFANTDSYHPVPGALRIGEGAVEIALLEVVNNSYKTFTASSNYSAVTIPGFNFTTRTFNIN